MYIILYFNPHLMLDANKYCIYMYMQAERRRDEEDEPFVFPYDLGTKKNLAEVCDKVIIFTSASLLPPWLHAHSILDQS